MRTPRALVGAGVLRGDRCADVADAMPTAAKTRSSPSPSPMVERLISFNPFRWRRALEVDVRVEAVVAGAEVVGAAVAELRPGVAVLDRVAAVGRGLTAVRPVGVVRVRS